MKESINPAQGKAGGSALQVRMAGPEDHRWFDAQLDQHHNLGAGQPVGDYLRQVVEREGQPVGLLVWGPACYALKDRDLWIGWRPQPPTAVHCANEPFEGVFGRARLGMSPPHR